MNARERTMALLVGGILGLAVLFFGGKAILVKPLTELDKKAAGLREKLDKIKAERRAYFTAETLIKKNAQHAFGDQVDQASAKSGEFLTQQILASGLRESDFSRLPVGPRRLRGASEIGWNVQGGGRFDDVIDLLFLLQESPYLHRLESLSMTAGDAPGQVKVRFRFLTLVVMPAPVVDPIDLTAKYNLDSPERHRYDAMVARDLLRPYIKRPPPGTGIAKAPAAGPAGGTPGPESFRIVSLSEWQGQPEVHIRDLTNQKTVRYKPGDALAGGTIVMVDYRPMPMPGDEALLSYSRVILRLGTEYWAVERGRTLADKHRLTTEQLPPAMPTL